jgi:biopolymer transport protein ExbB
MRRNWILVAAALCALTLAAAVYAQAETPAPETAAKKMTLWDLIVVGGWAMWPLGACSFGLIAMAALNFRQLNQKKLIPPATVAELRDAAAARDIGRLWQVATSTKSFFTDALAAGLRRIDPDNPAASKEKMEEAIGESVARQESQLGFWINILSLITAISPMLGLLGTVSGMIGAFQKIAGGGMGKPELLAGNIGEALITTAAGLIIAVPSMFFYFLFRNNLNRALQNAEEQFSIILDSVTGTGAEIVFEEAEPASPATPPGEPATEA